MPFGVTPIDPTIPRTPPEFAEFIQFESEGEPLSGPTVQIVNFLSPIKATRGVGENAHVITVHGPPAPPNVSVGLTGIGNTFGETGTLTASTGGYTLVWDHSLAPKADSRYTSVNHTELITLVGHFSILEYPYDISSNPLGASISPDVAAWTIVTTNLSPGDSNPYFPYAATTTGATGGVAANSSHSQGAIFNALDNGYGMVNFKEIQVDITATINGTPAAGTLTVVMTPDTVGGDTDGTAVFTRT